MINKRAGCVLLSTGTAVPPDIPRTLPTLCPLFPNLLACQPLVVTVVPLANGLGDFDFCPGSDRLLVLRLSLLRPGESFSASDLEKFQRSLRTGAG
jgi:hypothetical protein